jgi:hypothetical protein
MYNGLNIKKMKLNRAPINPDNIIVHMSLLKFELASLRRELLPSVLG